MHETMGGDQERLSERIKPIVAMVMVDIGFGVGNVLMKQALEDGLNSLVLITYRMVVSSLFLAPVSYFSERGIRPKLTFRMLGCFFLSATLSFVLMQYCFLYGMARTSATFACAFFNMVPVMTFLMAWPSGLETVNINQSTGKAKVTGAVICTVGAVTLMLYKGKPLFDHSPSSSLSSSKSRTTTMTVGWVISSLVLTLGSLAYSGWFILQSYIGKIYPCKYSSTAFMSLFGAIQSAIIAGILSSGGDRYSIWVLKGRIEIITVIYTGVINSGVCYAVMSWCVKRRDSVFTAAFSPFIQIIVAAIDIPLIHAQFYLGSLLGSVAVIMGLYALLWGKDREKRMQGKCPGSPQEEGGDNKAEAVAVLPSNVAEPCKVNLV